MIDVCFVFVFLGQYISKGELDYREEIIDCPAAYLFKTEKYKRACEIVTITEQRLNSPLLQARTNQVIRRINSHNTSNKGDIRWTKGN